MEIEEVLPKVADMLREFSDIVLDNVPNGFPPMRKINHQMDLVLGASFPNKVVHKMTPKKSEESKSMCFTSSISTKEEWRMEDVHKFLSHQQDHNQVHIFIAKDG